MKSLLCITLLAIVTPLSFAQTKSGESIPLTHVQQEIIDLEHKRLKLLPEMTKRHLSDL